MASSLTVIGGAGSSLSFNPQQVAVLERAVRIVMDAPEIEEIVVKVRDQLKVISETEAKIKEVQTKLAETEQQIGKADHQIRENEHFVHFLGDKIVKDGALHEEHQARLQGQKSAITQEKTERAIAHALAKKEVDGAQGRLRELEGAAPILPSSSSILMAAMPGWKTIAVTVGAPVAAAAAYAGPILSSIAQNVGYVATNCTPIFTSAMAANTTKVALEGVALGAQQCATTVINPTVATPLVAAGLLCIAAYQKVKTVLSKSYADWQAKRNEHREAVQTLRTEVKQQKEIETQAKQELIKSRVREWAVTVLSQQQREQHRELMAILDEQRQVLQKNSQENRDIIEVTREEQGKLFEENQAHSSTMSEVMHSALMDCAQAQVGAIEKTLELPLSEEQIKPVLIENIRGIGALLVAKESAEAATGHARITGPVVQQIAK